MQVRDIMTQPIVTTESVTTIEQAAQLMARHHVGALLVCDAEQIVGIVTDRDLVRRALAATRPAATTEIRSVMTRHPITVSSKVSVAEAAEAMAEHGFRRLPVVEDGRAVGMLSADDIARFCSDDEVVADMGRALATYMRPPAVAR